jgi:glycosyltransferase involved in cell wall biosynthesis
MIEAKITVLMPVYNGGKYLREAIDSILGQTFADFELLIINDGSTDNSCRIVESYRDSRIRLVSNPGNIGLIASLNRGIALSKGQYIARMDCDDICLPERLQRQVDYLDSNPACSLVATKVAMISATGDELGAWNDDDRFCSSAEIRQRLPRANCIAHPSVMVRKELLAAYGYDPAQTGCEDYDLWLRMTADGIRIDKLDLQLLRYRVTPGSVTAQSAKGHPDLKNLLTKARFCLTKILEGRINYFTIRVFSNISLDLYYFLGNLLIKLIHK